jgi:hypothetical protein
MRAVWLKEFGGPEVLVTGDAGCGGHWPTVETLRGLHHTHAAAIPFETATVAGTLSGRDGLGDRQAVLVDVVSGDPFIRDGEV